MGREKYKRREIVPPNLTTDYLYTRFRKKLINTAYSIFEWSNLPESIDEQFLTMELIEHGNVGIVKTPNGLTAVRGNVGGEINQYYKPTRYIYANPVIGSGQPKINEECAVLFLTREDETPFEPTGGLSQLIDSTSLLLADNIVSLNVAQKNSRVMIFASADDDSTATSAELTLNAMYAGKPFKVAQKRLTDSIEVNPVANLKTAENMRQLIENQQYILAHFLQELGINANFNLKRERLTNGEIALNSDCLDTLVDNMENTLSKGVETCNKLYGTNITIKIKRYGEEQEQTENNEVAPPQPETTETETTETETNKGGENDV